MAGTHQLQKNEARLGRAVQAVAAAWFPVNPRVFSEVRDKFFRGWYRGSRVALNTDLRSDPSLYLLCLREIAKTLYRRTPEAEHPAPSILGPDEEVIQEALSSLLAGSSLTLSAHSMENMTPMHQSRIEESLVSTVTAELVAERAGLTAEAAYSSALLRQVGLTLLAWNYPHVYSQALAAMQDSERGTSEDLDALVHSLLGFSPAMLAARVVEEWGLDPELARLVGEPGPGWNRIQAAARRGPDGKLGLAECCAIGEAFARANAPDRYPCAREEWRLAAPILRQFLGPNGFAEIFHRVREASGQYAAFCPGLLSGLERREQAANTLLKSGETINEQNVFVASCASVVRETFIELYEQQQEGTPLPVVLKNLAEKLVPQLQCAGLAIMTFDPTTQELVPVLQRGRVSTARIKAVGLQDGVTRLHPARLAFLQRQTLEERGSSGGVDRVLYAGSIGFTKRVAVLIAEWDAPTAGRAENGDVLTLFQAVRTCLTNLLGLE